MVKINTKTKRIRILFFITGLGKGGAEKQLFNLMSGLINKKNLEIKLISIFGGDYEKDFKKLGISVNVFFKNKNFNLFKSIFLFKKYVKDFKPDIVHSFLFHSNIISKFSLFFMKKNFKLICSYRSLIKKYPLITFLEYLNQWKTDLLICNSKRALMDLKIYNFFKVKKKIVYNGFEIKKINTKKAKEFKKKYKGKKIILTVGRFSLEKDYFTNIRTCFELSLLRDDFLFIYVGGNDYKKYLKFAKKLKILDKIVFLGKRDDVLELMSISKVFFLPTLYESQCNALMEAMYSKLPIVTTDLKENRELVKFAKFCKVKDYKCMAKKINEILNGSFNNNYLEKNYNYLINNFSKEKMVEKYYKIYEVLVR